MSNHLVFLIPLLFIFLLCPAVTTLALPPLTKPNCSSRCGEVDVPYPFGIDSDCFYSKGFRLVCDDSIDPPKLVMGSGVEVLDASYEGQLTVLSQVVYDCYNKTGGSTDWNVVSGISGNRSLFTLSDTQNKFTALGCDTISNISGYNGRVFQNGCSMFCVNKSDVINGSCTGIGCCQTSIPKGFASFNMTLKSFENHTNVFDFNPCSYGFVVKADWFNFSSSYLSKFTSPFKIAGEESVPVVFDWAVERKSCEEAKTNKTTYACSGTRSECVASKNDRGYSCVCSKGYKGNPYLQDGCQDIDECESPSIHNCSENAKCKNSIGGYSCRCPLGYRGNGWRNGTSFYGDWRYGNGCKDNILPIIAGIITGFLVLPVLLWFLYWAKKERERMILFKENGGKLLKQRLNSRKEATGDFKFISIKEIKRATENFRNELPFQGGFGTVYKGNLSEKAIMVRRYPLNQYQMKDQIIQFVNEVDVLSRINHKHVVKLLGCCLDTQIPMLVFEYVTPENNLPQHIQHLSWEDRLRIAAETAVVLDYLHSDSVPVFHGKFESSDILLQEIKKDDGSSKMVAKICDFGASRLVPLYQTLRMTRGELSHKSDELERSEKSDVYCFGVILVELLTGEKKDVSVFKSHLENLISERKDLSSILDENIAKDAKGEQLQLVVKLVIECLKDRSEDRPAMLKVKRDLEPFLSTDDQ